MHTFPDLNAILSETEAVNWRFSANSFAKFTEKHQCRSLFFNRNAGLRYGTLLKKRLWHRCFPVSFAKKLRKPFFKEHLWWLRPYYKVFCSSCSSSKFDAGFRNLHAQVLIRMFILKNFTEFTERHIGWKSPHGCF